MNDPHPPKRIFPTSKIDAQAAKQVPSSPQTESEAYKLAFQDTDFLLREDLRPVRFQLELLKPELFLDEAKIGSTFVFYGSARIPEPALADALVEGADPGIIQTLSPSSMSSSSRLSHSWKTVTLSRLDLMNGTCRSSMLMTTMIFGNWLILEL